MKQPKVLRLVPQHVTRAQLAQLCDLVIVVGGDGSVLSTGRSMRGTGVPLLELTGPFGIFNRYSA